MRRTDAIVLFLLALTATASAQGGPDTLWTRTFGGAGNDWCYAVQQTDDQGFVFAGQTNSAGNGGYDVFVVRTNLDGDTLWTRTYGGPANEGARAIRQLPGGGFIIAGSTLSFGSGLSDIYLLRLEADGDTLWTRAYGGPASDYGRAVASTSDGGFVALGITNSFGAGSSDVYLIRTDSMGDTVWTKTFGTVSADEGRALQVTADDGCIIAGAAWSVGSTWSDALFIRTDAEGDSLWIRTSGGLDQDWVNSVALTSDGGFIAAGQSWPSGASNPDIYLVKLAANGDPAWSQLLTAPGPGSDEAHAVIQTHEGGYLAAGYSSPLGSVSTDVIVVKTDSTGQTEWSRTYGGTQPDVAYAVIQTGDEGFVIGGETRSSGAGQYDFYAVATTAAPQVGDTVRDLRVYYYPDGDGVVLFWTVPRPGDYNIFSTIFPDLGNDPAEPGWVLEATIRVETPVARWVDTNALANTKYYLITRDYGLLFSRGRRHDPQPR